MNSSKVKGNGFERECVNKAKAKGIESQRAYASDGRSLGKSSEVDIVVGDWDIQCKRRKKIASFLQIPEGADAVCFREDSGRAFMLIDYDDFLDNIAINRLE
tara:strand:+ start:5339 stop:5644 length:306 start_codon:yes stop_codon:yes gene_type:complete